MKYILLFFYFSQVCTSGSPFSAPPYFYMKYFDTYEEANIAKHEISIKDGTSTILYVYPEFISEYDVEKLSTVCEEQ